VGHFVHLGQVSPCERVKLSISNSTSHMALILGRPRTINASDCTVKAPLDCDIPEDPSKRVPSTTNPHDAPSSYSSHLFHYALGQKTHQMLSLGADKPHLKDYSVVRTLHDQVVSLLNALPPVVRPENPDVSWDLRCPNLPKQRQHISSAASSFLIALHRPHVALHTESRHAAIQAALDCLESQQRLFDLISRHHYKIYTLSFYTIDAGIFLSATTLEHWPLDHALLQHIQRVLRQAIIRLDAMKERNPMAKSGAQILTTCYLKIKWSSLIGDDSVNQQIGAQGPSHMSGAQHTDYFSESGHLHDSQNPMNLSQPNLYDWGRDPMFSIDRAANFATFGGVTEGNPSLWLEQMGQVVDLDPTASIRDSTWSFLLG
jgi:hypothetical protein